MGEAFMGEVRMVGFSYPPRGWAFCNGQMIQINQNPTLYSIMGTMFGGDGYTTFGVPELRGRAPVHPGQEIFVGERSGAEIAYLDVAHMPAHRHSYSVYSEAADPTDDGLKPAGHMLASQPESAPDGAGFFAPLEGDVRLDDGAVANTGSSQPFHENRQPFLAVEFCICLEGLYPSRS